MILYLVPWTPLRIRDSRRHTLPMKKCCNAALNPQLRKPWQQRPVRLSCGEAAVGDSALFRFGLVLLHVNPEHSNEVIGFVLI